MVTWNAFLQPRCAFVVEAAKGADVVCLQEVTGASTEWLQEELGEAFHVVTPLRCGGAWSNDGHGVAVVVRREAFAIKAQRVYRLTSTQGRTLLTARLQARGGPMSLLLGTAHLESGPESASSRAGQRDERREKKRRRNQLIYTNF